MTENNLIMFKVLHEYHSYFKKYKHYFILNMQGWARLRSYSVQTERNVLFVSYVNLFMFISFMYNSVTAEFKGSLTLNYYTITCDNIFS
jgi:hypothetical protein